MKKLFDLCEVSEIKKWKSIDDRVMGGISGSGLLYYDECMAAFEGEVSLESGGGFASVRRGGLNMDLSGYTGIELKVKGDGKIYSFRLTNQEVSEGIVYQARFTALDKEWKIIKLPFEKFSPVFRGRTIYNAPHIDSSKISGFGFLIADKQEGPFRLIISSISAYK